MILLTDNCNYCTVGSMCNGEIFRCMGEIYMRINMTIPMEQVACLNLCNYKEVKFLYKNDLCSSLFFDIYTRIYDDVPCSLSEIDIGFTFLDKNNNPYVMTSVNSNTILVNLVNGEVIKYFYPYKVEYHKCDVVIQLESGMEE